MLPLYKRARRCADARIGGGWEANTRSCVPLVLMAGSTLPLPQIPMSSYLDTSVSSLSDSSTSTLAIFQSP